MSLSGFGGLSHIVRFQSCNVDALEIRRSALGMFVKPNVKNGISDLYQLVFPSDFSSPQYGTIIEVEKMSPSNRIVTFQISRHFSRKTMIIMGERVSKPNRVFLCPIA